MFLFTPIGVCALVLQKTFLAPKQRRLFSLFDFIFSLSVHFLTNKEQADLFRLRWLDYGIACSVRWVFLVSVVENKTMDARWVGNNSSINSVL